MTREAEPPRVDMGGHAVTWRIRPFQASDLPDVVRLEQDAFGHEAMPAPVFIQYLHLSPGMFFVAESDGAVVGYVFVDREEEHPNVGLVLSLAVDSTHRGEGIGRSLMGQAMHAATSAGMRLLELTVAPENKAALSLYRALGFKQVDGILRDYFGEGEHRILMSVRIPGDCLATDANLQCEAATSVSFSNLLAAIGGLSLAGLIASGSVNPVAYWYVALTLLGSLYSSQYYANVSGVVGRLGRRHDPERLLTIGNSLSEYVAFYPLVIGLPLVIALLTKSVPAAAVATLADLLLFGLYQLGHLNVESRQAGDRSSALTLGLVSLSTVVQVAAAIQGSPVVLGVACVLTSIALLILTARGIRSVEN